MISDNLRSLELTIVVLLPSDRPPKDREVRELATRMRTVFPVPDAEFDLLMRQLYDKLPVDMDV